MDLHRTGLGYKDRCPLHSSETMFQSLWIPFFFLTNGVVTHVGLTHWVPSYSLAPLKIRHEIVSRVTNTICQIYLITSALMNPEDMTHLHHLSSMFVAYFLCDMIHMLFYYYEFAFYIHHTIPILLYLSERMAIISIETMSATYNCAILLELTNPLLSLTWLLSKLQMKPWFYSHLTVFTYLFYFPVRIVYFTYYWYTVLAFAPKVLMTPILILNTYWFGLMTQYVLKKNIDTERKQLD
jgi:hypothetical protein